MAKKIENTLRGYKIFSTGKLVDKEIIPICNFHSFPDNIDFYLANFKKDKSDISYNSEEKPEDKIHRNAQEYANKNNIPFYELQMNTFYLPRKGFFGFPNLEQTLVIKEGKIKEYVPKL